MKRNLLLATLAAGLLAFAITLKAEEKKAEKPLPYPLKTCLITDEKLGGMGKPVVFVYKGQEIKFCCKGCEAKFNKDPEKFIKKMKELAKKEAKPGDASTNSVPAVEPKAETK